MKVAILSLAWNRKEITQHCFRQLWEQAGHPFDHYILDQGASLPDLSKWKLKSQQPSGDNCPQWGVRRSKKNLGVAGGFNYLLDWVQTYHQQSPYDLIVKMDNDCFLETDGLMALVETAQDLIQHYHKSGAPWFLSPRIQGLGHPPPLVKQKTISCTHGVETIRVDQMGMLGGIFIMAEARNWLAYKYRQNKQAFKGHYLDNLFAQDWKKKGGHFFYDPNVTATHWKGEE